MKELWFIWPRMNEARAELPPMSDWFSSTFHRISIGIQALLYRHFCRSEVPITISTYYELTTLIYIFRWMLETTIMHHSQLLLTNTPWVRNTANMISTNPYFKYTSYINSQHPPCTFWLLSVRFIYYYGPKCLLLLVEFSMSSSADE